ncbi:MAG: zinc ribbon domain-containing protein [Candidatus Methanoperedens sp.]|nr:zinc ribbon domain-containing protein [Candidatus Methanoperedens sp.]MCZ7404509.1 zinc ribbon domain-containing protein [Candidatus Methanoperedens sp.]
MNKITLFFFIFILLVNTASAVENVTKSSASVELHGEKTDVVLGEDIILKLSAVNIITKPLMTVQVILIPPSGMSVTSSEFVTSGAGQFTSTFNISTGAGRDIEVRIKTNQAGDFNVTGRVIYYFGSDQSTAEDHTLSLPIKVRTPPPTPVDERTAVEKTTGLSKNTLIIIGILALILILIIYRSMKKSAEAEALIAASVQLYGEKTDVVMGEDIVLKLSAVNVITKPAMTVQVIIIPPSGMSVTSSGFVTSGAGQYTTTYTVDPGAGKDFEVRIKPNQTGDFEVKGRVVYYFGKDKGTTKDHTLTLPVKVRPGENEYEHAAKLGVADVRSQHAVKSEVLDFGRVQKVKDAETDILIEQKEDEADFEEAKRGIEALRLLKQAKAEGKKAGDDKEGDDKGATIKFGRSGSITENGSIIQRSNIGAGAMKKCPHCGATLPKYAGFCGECGGKLG